MHFKMTFRPIQMRIAHRDLDFLITDHVNQPERCFFCIINLSAYSALIFQHACNRSQSNSLQLNQQEANLMISQNVMTTGNILFLFVLKQ